MAEDVLVIGAGPAGIACAYYLEQAGVSYKVVDKAAIIASTWDSLYPSLKLNTTRFYSHLPERKFPLKYGIFATGKQYHRYLVDYVRDHDFNIHLGVAVHNMTQEGDGWQVETSEGSAWYPAVISATGRFSAPVLPAIPGMENFKGRIIHAHDYLGPEPYIGKRVMVVGNGPSGIDISVELGNHAQQPVLLSQRTGVILRPIYPLGLPKHAWMLLTEKLPDFIGKPLMKYITGLKFNNLEQVGIKTPRGDAQSSAAGGTRGRSLILAARAGTVKSVAGPAYFEADEVVLTDGSRVQVDVVIMATGYRPALYDYLDLPDAERNQYDWPRREDEPPNVYYEGGRQVQGYPGLYLVGVYYQGKGAMYNFNIEAEQAVQEIQARLQRLENKTDTRMDARQSV